MTIILILISFFVSCLYWLLDKHSPFIGKLKIVSSFFYLYCYPIYFISTSNCSDNDAFFFYSLNTCSITALAYYTFGHLLKKRVLNINSLIEDALNYLKSTTVHLALESVFDFPQAIDWTEIEGSLQEVSQLMKSFLRDGKVS